VLSASGLAIMVGRASVAGREIRETRQVRWVRVWMTTLLGSSLQQLLTALGLLGYRILDPARGAKLAWEAAAALNAVRYRLGRSDLGPLSISDRDSASFQGSLAF